MTLTIQLTERHFGVPAGWYATLWFARLQPLKEVRAVQINIRLQLLKSCEFG